MKRLVFNIHRDTIRALIDPDPGGDKPSAGFVLERSEKGWKQTSFTAREGLDADAVEKLSERAQALAQLLIPLADEVES